MAAEAMVMTGKRRNPFSTNDDLTNCELDICMDVDDSPSISCECQQLGQTYHKCSHFETLPKKACDGVSSLKPDTNNFQPGDMQDFFAMQCNNNTSAVNYNRMAPANVEHTMPSADSSEQESQTLNSQVSQASSDPSQCVRCISGGPGHISHIMS